MKNFSLKYLIIGVVLLSAIMIVGALLFNKIGPNLSKKQPSPTPTPKTNKNLPKPVAAPKADNIPNPSPPQIQPKPVNGVQK